MVGVEPDADLFAHRMIVVAGDHREHGCAAWQPQRVQKFRSPKCFADHLGLQGAGVIMYDVVRA